MKELVSFLTTRKEIAEEEKQGRISGSVEWRRARGELGKTKEVGASVAQWGLHRVNACSENDL
jgi:hypothetical protein